MNYSGPRIWWSAVGLTAILMMGSAHAAYAAQLQSVTGTIKNISATTAGVVVRFKGDRLPQICLQSTDHSILISKDDKPIMDLFMSAWSQGKRRFTIYTNMWKEDASGNPYAPNYCTAARVEVR